MESGFQGVRTHWNRGFRTFRLVRRTRNVMLMVPVGPEPGFWGGATLGRGDAGAGDGG